MERAPLLLAGAIFGAAAFWLVVALIVLRMRQRMALAEQWLRQRGRYTRWAVQHRAYLRFHWAAQVGLVSALLLAIVCGALASRWPGLRPLSQLAVVALLAAFASGLTAHALLYRRITRSAETAGALPAAPRGAAPGELFFGLGAALLYLAGVAWPRRRRRAPVARPPQPPD